MTREQEPKEQHGASDDTEHDMPEHLVAVVEQCAGAGLSSDPNDYLASDDDIDPLHGLAFDRPLFEQLMLAIIRANPVGQRTPEQRLGVVMEELFGQTHVAPIDSDEAALLWMAELAQVRSDGGATPSARALALEAAKKFYALAPELYPATAERLRRRFGGTYPRRRGSEGVDLRRTLAYRLFQHDYVAESVGAKRLQRVLDELAQWGIKTKI